MSPAPKEIGYAGPAGAFKQKPRVLHRYGCHGRDVAENRSDFTYDQHLCNTFHERWLKERPQDYGALMRECVLVGAFFRAVDYVQATRQRAVLAQQFARCLDTVDVAITASSMNPACPVEDAERCESTYQRQARAV